MILRAGNPRALIYSAGSHVLLWTGVGLVAAGITFNAEAGSYALTGSPATLEVHRVLVAEPGSYSIVGQDGALLVGRVLDAEPGAYTLTGDPATILVQRVMNAEPGVYTLTGLPATLAKVIFMNAEPGVYQVVGAPASATMEVDLVIITGNARPRQNVALPNFPFVMLDSAGTPTAGLTVTGTIAQDGGAFGALTNSVVDSGNGWYSINLTAAEMNGLTIALHLTAAGAQPRLLTLVTAT